jgi:hypothetical protein
MLHIQVEYQSVDLEEVILGKRYEDSTYKFIDWSIS